MKAIGHTDGGTKTQKWSSTPLTDPLSPHTLYIPEPGMRENIDADQFEHVGWVVPTLPGGGRIFDTRILAGDDSRPAYLRRVDVGSRNHEVADAVARTVQGLGPDDPMDVRRSEFDALTKRFDLLAESTTARIWALEKIRYQQPASTPSIPPDKFLSEVLEFCNTRLDEHRGSISSENAYADCNRANTYIRELVRRLQAAAEPRCLKCGAQVDERWDCCETHESTSLFHLSTDDVIKEALEFCSGEIDGVDYPDTVSRRKQFARCADYIRELIDRIHGLRTPPHSPTPVEPPMTFYDHAFIAAYMALMGIGRYGMDEAVARSHSIAGKLTRNRANQP